MRKCTIYPYIYIYIYIVHFLQVQGVLQHYNILRAWMFLTQHPATESLHHLENSLEKQRGFDFQSQSLCITWRTAWRSNAALTLKKCTIDMLHFLQVQGVLQHYNILRGFDFEEMHHIHAALPPSPRWVTALQQFAGMDVPELAAPDRVSASLGEQPGEATRL